MSFTEDSTVEKLIRDLLCGGNHPPHRRGCGPRAQKSASVADFGWHYLAPDEHSRVSRTRSSSRTGFVEALIRLNPDIAAVPDRADEVLYKLRAIVLSVRSDGLLKANEELTAWLRGDRSMPFGPNNEHITVRLIDFENLENNQYVVTSQFTFRAGPAERRADLVLLVNGLPARRHRGQDAGAPRGELARRRATGPRRLREVRPGALRRQRVQRRHRGQGADVRLRANAREPMGPVARRGRGGAGNASRASRRR